MTIETIIRDLISIDGYLCIDELMKEVLTRNFNSYYKQTLDIGKEGDFITSPEISQLFGETIAAWIVNQWYALGKPNDFILFELGPGNGILMRDIIRVFLLEKKIINSVTIIFYETNNNFIMKQQKNLKSFDVNILWIDDLDKIPPKPTIIISNEFFDCLPIKQFKKIKHNWYEVILCLDPRYSYLKFDTVDVNENLQNYLNYEHPKAKDGAIFEESIETLKLVKKLARLIKNYSGSFLAIDYGYNIAPTKRKSKEYNSTLQAVKNHQYQPIIDTLGSADLTAHVDLKI